MSRCIEAAGEQRAQATVEAALLLPVFLLVLLLCLQPVCLLYTRCVMEATAAQTARLLITGTAGELDAYEAFALRRLAAVPDLEIFHLGGPMAWDIELEGAGSEEGGVRVMIAGDVRPLPVLGAFASMAGLVDERGVVRMVVEVTYEGRPSWLEGDYEAWMAGEGA